MQRLVAERGLEHEVKVDSAGTAGYHHGNRADSRMRAAAGSAGLRVAQPSAAGQHGRSATIRPGHCHGPIQSSKPSRVAERR